MKALSYPLRSSEHSLAGENAMTEIALALAMGFFAIMVLTLVSMNAGPSIDEPIQMERFEKIQLQAPQQDSPTQDAVAQDDMLIVYHQGQYFDPNLKPLDIGSLGGLNVKRVILALAPSLSMQEALKAQQDLAVQNLVISTLTPDWLTRLEGFSK